MKQIIFENEVTEYKISKTGQCFNIYKALETVVLSRNAE